MNEVKEAIVFIPGFDAGTKDYYIDNYLAIGLTTRLERQRVFLEPDEVKIAGQTGRRFTVTTNDTRKTIDVYEIFWNDLVTKLSQKNLKAKVCGGFSLFAYWLSYTFNIARKSKIFAMQITVFVALVVLWYYGTVVMLLTAIGNDRSILGTQLPQDWATALGQLGNTLGGWSIWIYTSVIISFFPASIDIVIDLLDFASRYMRDETLPKNGALRDRLRARLATALDNVINSGEYQQVTVLSHSMGTLVSTDLMADYSHPKQPRIRYITLGSPIEALATCSNWLKTEVVKCLDNPLVANWVDFYSSQDWLCTKVPKLPTPNLNKLTSHPINLKVSLADQLVGASHQMYFFDPRVLEEIVLGASAGRL